MVPALFLYASLVNDVRSLLARNDFADADRIVRSYEAQAGGTPEAAAALSWLARGEFEARDYDRADSYASEARKLSDQILRTRKLDSDPWLPMAVGASVEVHAQVLAARGDRSDAVLYLRQQLKLLAATSLAERVQKNLNLLSLEGKSAPPLAAADFIGNTPPTLAALRGHPVLLFFWAHWCPDCKAEVPIVVDLIRIYAPKGLIVIGPTKLYGFAAGGDPASPADEKRYIEKIRQQYYSALANMPVPLDSGNFRRYGASTTPTLVLLDGNGIVRFYHPGAASEAELSAHIQAVLSR
jgi:thiol-disulfide isomerase/thioredoxin